MNTLGLCLLWMLLATMSSAESGQEAPPVQEPSLHDYYVSLQRLEKSLAARSLDEQARLQPQIQRTQRRACERLQKEHREGVSKDEYRRQGGDEFLVFAWQLESFCQARQ